MNEIIFIIVFLFFLFTVIYCYRKDSNSLSDGQLDQELLLKLIEEALKQERQIRPVRQRVKEPLAQAIVGELGDVYTPYESGLDRLCEQLGHAHPRYLEALIYEQQLTQNIRQTRRSGDTEARRMERSEIIEQLNRLTLSELGISFNRLLQKTEAFALARIEGIEDNTPLHLATEYKLLTGISHERSERPIGFTVQKFALPDIEMIEIDITVRASGFDISPDWHQRVKVIRGQDSDLLEFILVPKEIGDKKIEVEFYYQQHWLTAIVLDVTVVAPDMGGE